MSDNKPRRPRAIVLPDETASASKTAKPASTKAKRKQSKQRRPRAVKDAPVLREVPLEAAQRFDTVPKTLDALAEDLPPPPAPPSSKRFKWSKVFFAAAGGLISLAFGLWLDQLVRDLFARQDWLGWIAVGLTALLILAIVALIVREVMALRRLSQISSLQKAAEQARIGNDMKQARSVSAQIVDLYEDRPDTAAGRAALKSHSEEIIDGRDLIHLTERDLLRPLDAKARAMVMASAKRVSVVTAVSPRAIVDISYVLLENTRLIRSIAEHYGGRPGTLGFWRLARTVLTHLAVTGSIAVGDGLMQQLIGSGLAAKLSARLGEGVVNGMLTARIGIAAIDVCRPLPFAKEARPGVKDFMGELLKGANVQDSAQKS
ncbi:YcjF family protein [Pseudahrensia aquimaris]|uniref:UPF0283 membrane protein ACFQ14_14070 n=1 Tax=Pseudahrensia aquimaris TaxID=744461 RepID=A0ABW3FIC3_9HYPH